MPKSQPKPKLEDQILEVLSEGEKQSAEIKKAISGNASSIDTRLSKMEKSGKVTRVDKGIYRLPEPQDAPAGAENSREASDNTETINKMLNVYDLLLDDIVVTLASELATKTTIEAKIDLIKSLRWVAATIDQLMKRWYLVHRGYDSNTRQAQEDAKQKTSDRKKQEMEHLPPEEQLEVVGDYDVEMRELLESLPEATQKEVTV